MGFEPVVDSSGKLVKMIVRAWADNFCRFFECSSMPGTRSGDVHCIEGEEDGREVWQLAVS